MIFWGGSGVGGWGVGVEVKHQVLLMLWLKYQVYVVGGGSKLPGPVYAIFLFVGGGGGGLMIGPSVRNTILQCQNFEAFPKVWARSDTLTSPPPHPTSTPTSTGSVDLTLQ